MFFNSYQIPRCAVHAVRTRLVTTGDCVTFAVTTCPNAQRVPRVLTNSLTCTEIVRIVTVYAYLVHFAHNHSSWNALPSYPNERHGTQENSHTTCLLANCVFTCEQVLCVVLGEQSLLGGVSLYLGRRAKNFAPRVCHLNSKLLVVCGGICMVWHEHRFDNDFV